MDILKDGVVLKSVILSSSNNWSYSWEVSDKTGNWSVSEKDVPAGYQVLITKNKTAFTVTNTKVPDDPDKPDEPYVPDEPETPDKPKEPEEEPYVSVFSGSVHSEVPKTGDTYPVLLYAVIMCISGTGLMMLGILKLRERNREKNR